MHADGNRSLCAYLDGLMDDLRVLLPRALQQNDEEAIHDARVTCRRLKAAVDVCGDALPAEVLRPFRRTLRKLRRRLGPLRDADVMLVRLDAPGMRGRFEGGHEWLRGRLIEHRDALRKESARPGKWLDRLVSWWAVRDALGRADVDWGAIVAGRLRSQCEEFQGRADAVAGALSVRSQAAADAHSLRIAGKLLRYTLELGGAVRLETPRGLLRTFKAFQDALGSWHDFVVLSQRMAAEASASGLAYREPRIYEQLLAMARVTWARSGRDLVRFGRLWRKNGCSVTARIQAVAGLGCGEEALPVVRPSGLAGTEQTSDAENEDEPIPRSTCPGDGSADDGRPAAE